MKQFMSFRYTHIISLQCGHSTIICLSVIIIGIYILFFISHIWLLFVIYYTLKEYIIPLNFDLIYIHVIKYSEIPFNIVAIIPTRGGSKGIPNKNFCGKPLITHSIESANQSTYINEL